jgi:hypothetical protein
MPIVRSSDCVSLPMVFCPVIVVVMLKSWVARCVHCDEDVAYQLSLNIFRASLCPSSGGPTS